MLSGANPEGVEAKDEQNDTQKAQRISLELLQEFLNHITKMLGYSQNSSNSAVNGAVTESNKILRTFSQHNIEDVLCDKNISRLYSLLSYYQAYLSSLDGDHSSDEEKKNQPFSFVNQDTFLKESGNKPFSFINESTFLKKNIETLDFIFATSFTWEERGKINNPAWITMLTEMHHSLIVEQSKIVEESKTIVEEIKHQESSQSGKSEKQLKFEKKKLDAKKKVFDAKQKVFKEIQESFMILVEQTKKTDCRPNQQKISPEMKNLHAAIKNFQAVVEKNNDAIDPSLASKIIRFIINMFSCFLSVGFVFWGATVGTFVAPGAGTIAGAQLGGVIGGTIGLIAGAGAGWSLHKASNAAFVNNNVFDSSRAIEGKLKENSVVSNGYCFGLFGRKVELPNKLVNATTENGSRPS